MGVAELDFYKNKKIFITGHNGFKGSWMCKVLKMVGAKVMGYSLEPLNKPNIYEIADIGEGIKSITGDIRDFTKLKEAMLDFRPEIVIHMSAQPIVRISYEEPLYTYETNVIGTANVLESIRLCDSVKSVIIVTTDKVYKNNEWLWGYRETDELNGYDPYSNSKSCAELVTNSYINSFFKNRDIAISTVRAGNVIGGGDFAKDRIIPDCIKAAINGEKIIIRNPYSIRPYQHVLESIIAYLMIAARQYDNKMLAGVYNVGPNENDCIETGRLVTIFCEKFGNLSWESTYNDGPHEAGFLKLDCSRLKYTFGWSPRWNVEMAVEKVVEWTKCYIDGKNVNKCMEEQIKKYLGNGNIENN
ncbi:MAG: CDP-glucose 4,6-dehydratase [Bacilli bacterium]|nr:CDP-glucose 4,6-dehydratase [Bacilli bacterium]MDD4298823.1 CDP-glucose 4,6-dehydratase [Bacilli bacterium]MDD4644020.1 CDP-glucose 4,6-dehydratase [Bacilli bacterium]